MSVAALKKFVAAESSKDSAVDWTIGWLAHEDKYSFRKDCNTVMVSLPSRITAAHLLAELLFAAAAWALP
jgi:hypothetical protein